MSPSLTAVAIVTNMLLIVIAAGLIRRHLRRRALETAQLESQRQRLEHEVADRTRELAELSTHLQSVSEREKAALARELHDELGGLLVGARMDISWAEQHLGIGDLDLKQRLNRAQQNLSTSIDLKRRIIEELRPTLLDNVGFIAALRWQMKETCMRGGLKCNEYFPSDEPRLNPDAAIALFRIAQECFSNILRMSAAKTVDATLDIDGDTVLFRITEDGRGISDPSFESDVHTVASMRHRVRALGGTFAISGSGRGGILEVRIPTARALRSASDAEISPGGSALA